MQLGDATRVRNRFSFRSTTGPSSSARNRIDESVLSAFELIIDNFVVKTIVDFSNDWAKENNIARKLQHALIAAHRLFKILCNNERQIKINLPMLSHFDSIRPTRYNFF